MVYNWVTGPHDKRMDNTVPVMLARVRSNTLFLHPSRTLPTDAIRESHLSSGTLNSPFAKSTSKPNRLLCWEGTVHHFGTLIRRPALMKSPSILRARRAQGAKPCFMNMKSSRYGRTRTPSLLQNIASSLMTFVKTQGAVESPKGKQL